jgi:hypothetical protein
MAIGTRTDPQVQPLNRGTRSLNGTAIPGAHWDRGAKTAWLIRIYGGKNLIIQEQPKDMDFVVKSTKSPLSLDLSIKREDE